MNGVLGTKFREEIVSTCIQNNEKVPFSFKYISSIIKILVYENERLFHEVLTRLCRISDCFSDF